MAEVYKPGENPEIDKIMLAGLADQAWRGILDSIRRAQAEGKAGHHLLIALDGPGGGEFRVPVPTFPVDRDPDYGRGHIEPIRISDDAAAVIAVANEARERFKADADAVNAAMAAADLPAGLGMTQAVTPPTEAELAEWEQILGYRSPLEDLPELTGEQQRTLQSLRYEAVRAAINAFPRLIAEVRRLRRTAGCILTELEQSDWNQDSKRNREWCAAELRSVLPPK